MKFYETRRHLKPMSQSLLLTFFVILMMLCFSGSARASSSYLTAFLAQYPSSTTATTASWSTSGARCNVCHSSGGDTPVNAYGNAWAIRHNAGRTPAQAFQDIELDNSDGSAVDNTGEITANAQPGWRPGANNTLYDHLSPGTVVASNQNPPTTLIGSADPASSLPTVTIAATSPNASEVGMTTGTFTLTRTGATTSALTVNYAISGAATNGTDYSTLSGSATIAAGSPTGTITVTPLADALTEVTETVILTLSASAAYTVGSPNSATVNIADNPPLPPGSLQFSAGTFSVNENGVSATITITRTGGSNGAVGATFATSNGTATAGSDYTAVSQTVSFANGDTASKTVNVPITNDSSFEGNETVNLTLSSPTGGASLGSPSTAVLTIVDDDPASIPNIVVSLLSIDFGNVTEKTNSDQKVNIANTGLATLTVSAALDATSSSDFSIVTGPPATIGAGLSADVTLRYTPNSVGNDAGALVINSNDPDMPQVKIPLSGSGVAAPVLACLINIGPASLDFGTLNLGGSATKQVTVSNNGTGNCNVMAALSGSVDFSASPLGSFTVAPAKSQTVDVTYIASDAASDAGTLDFASDDPNKPNVAVGLKGAGPAAQNIVVSPLSVDFGNVTEMTNSDRKVNIANTGQLTLTVSAALDATSSSDFSIVTGPPATIGAGLSADVTVRYTPNAVGSDAGVLVINSDDPDIGEITVPLKGNGIVTPVLACVINVGPASLDFGMLNLNGSATKQVTVSNNGTADCNVTAAQDPTTSPDFSASPLGSYTVAPGNSQTVNVTYTCSNAGSDTGALNIASNDPNKPNITVGLKGAGAQSSLLVKELEIDGAKWEPRTPKLSVKGEVELARDANPSGVMVTITDANNGALLGMVAANSEGEWRLEKVVSNRNLVPCRVRAEAGGLKVTKRVEGAPQSCQGGIYSGERD